ncbi:alpha/beta fold hydrolase [Variovorax sp. HJSM1_2]|uniref:alpha/beta fold hydrolase n=1 Tax=Variovorax sp. HJSM1_2 TaxID=3366263 RepID=UPI003BCBF6A6
MSVASGATAARPLIVFSHANSFPAATYTLMFGELRQRGFEVVALDKFGHDPALPVTNNWPHLVQQLADFAAAQVAAHGAPAFLVGHSLGGFLSLMTAARHPQLARGVLMIDSPVLGGWRASALGLVKSTPLVGSITPGKVSRRRRNRWPDVEAAFEHFRHKKAFAQWDERVLRDYVEHGMHDEDGQRVLSFDRDVETAIYNTLPNNLDRLLRTHPLQCPAAFIGGTRSEEMRQVGMALTHKVVGGDGTLPGRISMLDGSHLFPMEKPVATAAAIEAALRNLLG